MEALEQQKWSELNREFLQLAQITNMLVNCTAMIANQVDKIQSMMEDTVVPVYKENELLKQRIIEIEKSIELE